MSSRIKSAGSPDVRVRVRRKRLTRDCNGTCYGTAYLRATAHARVRRHDNINLYHVRKEKRNDDKESTPPPRARPGDL